MNGFIRKIARFFASTPEEVENFLTKIVYRVEGKELEIVDPRYIKFTELMEKEGYRGTFQKRIRKFFVVKHKVPSLDLRYSWYIGFYLENEEKYCVLPRRMKGLILPETLGQLLEGHRYCLYLVECKDRTLSLRIFCEN